MRAVQVELHSLEHLPKLEQLLINSGRGHLIFKGNKLYMLGELTKFLVTEDLYGFIAKTSTVGMWWFFIDEEDCINFCAYNNISNYKRVKYFNSKGKILPAAFA